MPHVQHRLVGDSTQCICFDSETQDDKVATVNTEFAMAQRKENMVKNTLVSKIST